MKSQVSNILSFFSSISDKSIAIGTHRKADIDALASAYAISSLFKNAVICMSDEPNTASKELAVKLGIKYTALDKLNPKKFHGMVVVDTSAYELLKEAKKWDVLAIIDHHHADGRDMKAQYELIDEHAPSTCELVTDLLFGRYWNAADKIDKKIAFALACGIISDTARFKNSSAKTFDLLAKLMMISGAEYGELLVYAEPEFEADEKIAILKCYQRLNFMISGNFVIVTSEVGSNESLAAASLSDVADIVFVASWREKDQETRISARSRKHVKVELNKVMGDVGKSFGASGGGHIHAAGATAKCKPDEALKRCIDITLHEFSKV